MTMPASGTGAVDAGGALGGGAPAGSGAPDPSGVPAGGGAPSAPAWLEGVPQDLAQWVGEQGFQSPADVIASQRGLMKLKGVPERELLRVPEKWDENPETAAAIHARLGRPEKPEGYEIPDVMVGDGDVNLANDFRKWAFDAGLSGRQAKALATQYQGALQQFATQRSEALALRDSQEEIALKAEWGGAFEENVGAGKRAYQTLAKAVGLEEKDIVALQQSLGYEKVMKLFASMGRALGEHEPPTGEPEAAFGLTPATATKRANEITAQLHGMDRMDPRYQQLLDEKDRLSHLASGEVYKGIQRG